MGNDGLLDVVGAAAYLGVKRSSVYQMSMRKTIPIVRIGRLIRFSKTDLDEFIRQRKEDAVDALSFPYLP